MHLLIGEYDCKLDLKGRFLVPSKLRKQLPEELRSEFVINRGLDECLTMYPIPVWEEELKELKEKNKFVEKNRTFLRVFLNGAMKVELDGNGRMLIPKRLVEQAGLEKEIILVAQIDKVEIWDKAKYEAWMKQQLSGEDGKKVGDLAEDVMGGKEG